MANPNRSDKRRYKSSFGAEWITGQQLLAEMVVARKAKSKGIDLPLFFWNTTQWKREFLLQLRYANSLTKIYDIVAVLKALKSKAGSSIWSLNAPWLDPLCQEEQAKLDRQAATTDDSTNSGTNDNDEPVTSVDTTTAPRPEFITKPSALSKLRKLD